MKLGLNLLEEIFPKPLSFFDALAFWFLGLLITSLLLTLLGIFYYWLVVILGIFSFGFILIWSLKNKLIIFKKDVIILLGISLLWLGFLAYFSSPTVFSGRDQGSFAEAAIDLSRNHKLETSFQAEKDFFNIYGQGKALNFPGFYYTHEGELITQFPLGYIAYLAVFFSLFGLFGFFVANALAFLLFIFSFYFIAKKIIQGNYYFWPIVLVFSSFAFSWFFKFSLGENLALGLLWFAIWQAIKFWEQKDKKSLFLLIISLGYMFFIRPETILLALAVIIIFWVREKKGLNLFRQVNLVSWIGLSVMTVLFILSLFVNQEFYRVTLKSFHSEGLGLPGLGIWQEIGHTFNVFSIYSLTIFLAFSFLGIVFLLKKKNYLKLIPFFVILPTCLYLIDPGISNDHPWMLRRFLYSIIPVIFLYAIVFLDSFFQKKKTFVFFATLLTIYNLMVSLPYLTFVPQGGLLAETKKLSQNFSDQDLILVDRLATGDPYEMMAGPLRSVFQKQAVYFFNVNDLNKINLDHYQKVYFIISDENLDFYAESGLIAKLTPKQDYYLEKEVLIVQESKWQLNLPTRQKIAVFGKLYEYQSNL